MNANPILLQKKYARMVELYAKENGISVGESPGRFLPFRAVYTHERGSIRHALYE